MNDQALRNRIAGLASTWGASSTPLDAEMVDRVLRLVLTMPDGVCSAFKAGHAEPDPADPEARCARCSRPRVFHDQALMVDEAASVDARILKTDPATPVVSATDLSSGSSSQARVEEELKAALIEAADELDGIVHFYRPEGWGSDDLSSARELLPRLRVAIAKSDATTARVEEERQVVFQRLIAPHLPSIRTLEDCSRVEYLAWANDVRDHIAARSDEEARLINVIVRGANQLNALLRSAESTLARVEEPKRSIRPRPDPSIEREWLESGEYAAIQRAEKADEERDAALRKEETR